MSTRTWRVAVVAVITTAVVAAGTGGAGAQTKADTSTPRTVTVNGTGMIEGTPDVLELTIGVHTHAKSAGEALGHNSDLAGSVIAVLRDAGLEADDVQTSNLWMSAMYDDDGDHVIGYAVSNIVTAKIRDLGKAGKIIDAATKVAGDEIVVNGLYFSFDDNTALVTKARAEAVKRARTQAEQLAHAAGVELGDLLSMSEDASPVGPVLEAEAAAPRSVSDGSAPIEPGAETLSVQVTLVYEIR
jgi:uncharacterized protein YggE